MDVIYWDEPENLPAILTAAIEARMTNGDGLGERQPYQIWREALSADPTAFQILMPHRGELHDAAADLIAKITM